MPVSIEAALLRDGNLVDPACLIDAVSAAFPDGAVQADVTVDAVRFTADRPATLVELAGPLLRCWQDQAPGVVLRLVGATGDAELRSVDADQAMSVLRGYLELLGPIEVSDAGDASGPHVAKPPAGRPVVSRLWSPRPAPPCTTR